MKLRTLFPILLFVFGVCIARAQYSSLYTPSTFSGGPDFSRPVGTLAGSAQVSLTGGATYTIPIPCAPGTNGMTPALSVSYSSQIGDGIMGRGWNLTGISSVIRAGHDLYHDGRTGPTRYSNEDHFILNGLRLVPKAGANGAHGTIYSAEEENYAVTTSFGSVGGGPERFTVVNKDGSCMEFGGRADARLMSDDGTVVAEWFLSRIKDIHGNYIDFVYTGKDRDFRLSEVRYTGNERTGMATYNMIRFSYQERSDKNSFYDRICTRSNRYLLSSIALLADGTTYTEMLFRYGIKGGISFLKEVEQKFSTGSFNETRFLYGDASADFVHRETDLSVPYSSATPLISNYDIFSGDYDGDGKSEILRARFNYAGAYYKWDRNYLDFQLYRADGSGKYSAIPAGAVSFPLSSSESKYIVGYQKNTDKRGNHFLQADFDGDGREDILCMNIGTGGEYKGVTIYYSKMGTASPGFHAVNYAPATISGKHKLPDRNPIFIGDFDGDHASDFAYLSQSTDPVSGVVSYNMFVSFPRRGEENRPVKMSATSSISAPQSYWLNERPSTTLDFDGDGQTDILTYYPSHMPESGHAWIGTLRRGASGAYYFEQLYAGGYPTEPYHDVLGVGDFNGDGKSDLLVASKPYYITTAIAYSTGKDFKEIGFPMIPFFNNTCKADASSGSTKGRSESLLPDFLQVGDFDGDGKSDIWHGRRYCTTEAEYLSKTDMVFYLLKGHTAAANIFEKHQFTVPYLISEVIRPVSSDVDGDGQAEISLKPYDKGMMWQFFLKPADESRLLVRVRNGMGVQSQFTYDKLSRTDGKFYLKEPSPGYPFNYASYPLPVVTGLAVSDGLGGFRKTNYVYTNLIVHRAAKGILGFGNVQVIDETDDLRRETQFKLQETYVKLYQRRLISYQHRSGRKLSQQQSDYTFSSLTGAAYRFKSELTTTKEEDALTEVNTTTNNVYDDFGNCIRSEAKTEVATFSGSSTLLTVMSDAAFAATGGCTVPNKPVEIITTTQRAGALPVIQRDSFRYQSNGALVCKKTFTGTAGLYVKDSSEYDDYGNIVKTVKMGSFPAKTTIHRFEFDARQHRFCVKEFDPLGAVTQTTWHPFWGKPTYTVAPNGLPTVLNYDATGSLVSRDIYHSVGTFYTVTVNRSWGGTGLEVFYTEQIHPAAPDTRTYFDLLGRELRSETEGFSGKKTSWQNYDARGNLSVSSNSFYATETPMLTTRTYDEFNRIESITDFKGKTSYTYSSGAGESVVVITTPDGKMKKTVTDGTGKVKKVVDGATGTVHFEYDSRGNEVSAQMGTEATPYVTLTRKEYDGWGNLKKLIDPDAGTTVYTYNVYGQLISQKDALAKTTNFEYDVLGRLITQNVSGYGTTLYEYFGEDKDYRLKKASSSFGGVRITDEYDYEPGSGMTRHARTGPRGVLEKTYTYDRYGRQQTTYFANSGFRTRNTYDANGFLKQISTDLYAGLKEQILYQTNSVNGEDQLSSFTRADGLSASLSYTNGYPVSMHTPGIQHRRQSFDFANANVTSRSEGVLGTHESFSYDRGDRLIQSVASYPAASPTHPSVHVPVDIRYDDRFYGSLGQISSKSDVGNYKYGGASRNAVMSVSDPAGIISHETQEIRYNAFNKVERITETIGTVPYEELFYYGPDMQRACSEQMRAGSLARRRTYFGDFEMEEDMVSGGRKMLHYISTPAGDICGVVTADVPGSFDYYGVYTDHLGSIVALTDQSGSLIGRREYDPWGRERNPDTWDFSARSGSGSPEMPVWMFRGFTGHEMLTEYGLINMNGRLYDPVNGRMLRPDNFVQDPGSTQSYNRYSYCWNNPLKYTDPSGEIIFFMPHYTMGSDGKPDVGFTIGIGLPNTPVSLGLTLGHDFSSGNTYGAASVGTGGFAASAGWGTQSGFFAAAGWGSGGYSGLSSNAAGLSVGVSQHGGFFANVGPFSINSSGLHFRVSLSYAESLVADYPGAKEGGWELEDGEWVYALVEREIVVYGKSARTMGRSVARPLPWMMAAQSQLGVKERSPGENPAIIAFHATTGKHKADEIPWCSSFVNWSMAQAGIRGTNSARALSWGNWGRALQRPAYGSIAVIDYGSGRGHVGFVAGKSQAGQIVLLGGNQSDMVRYSAFSATAITRYVYPKGYTPSYNLPLLSVGGAGNINTTR